MPEMSRYANAIGLTESSNRYNSIGRTHPRYGRPLGRYQVMESNLGEWTEAALGRRLTAEEFLASPEAQDAVFRHRFGQYVARYGPEGAARAWFAGERGMNDLGRTDSLDTSVAEYERRFTENLQPPNTSTPPPRGRDIFAPPPETDISPPGTDTPPPASPPPLGRPPPVTDGINNIVAELMRQRDPALVAANAAASDMDPAGLPLAPRRSGNMQLRAPRRRLGV
jgi:hypothetical protein